MNKQPFYHRAIILFTATEPISEEELYNSLLVFLNKDKRIVPSHTEIESYMEPEAGNPDDLMG